MTDNEIDKAAERSKFQLIFENMDTSVHYPINKKLRRLYKFKLRHIPLWIVSIGKATFDNLYSHEKVSIRDLFYGRYSSDKLIKDATIQLNKREGVDKIDQIEKYRKIVDEINERNRIEALTEAEERIDEISNEGKSG